MGRIVIKDCAIENNQGGGLSVAGNKVSGYEILIEDTVIRSNGGEDLVIAGKPIDAETLPSRFEA